MKTCRSNRPTEICYAAKRNACATGRPICRTKKENVQQVVAINNPVGLSFISYDHNPLTAGIVIVSHHRQQVLRKAFRLWWKSICRIRISRHCVAVTAWIRSYRRSIILEWIALNITMPSATRPITLYAMWIWLTFGLASGRVEFWMLLGICTVNGFVLWIRTLVYLFLIY